MSNAAFTTEVVLTVGFVAAVVVLVALKTIGAALEQAARRDALRKECEALARRHEKVPTPEVC